VTLQSEHDNVQSELWFIYTLIMLSNVLSPL